MSNLIIYRAINNHIRVLTSWIFQPSVRALTRRDAEHPCCIIIMVIPASAWLSVPNAGQAVEARTLRVHHGSESLPPISSSSKNSQGGRLLLCFISLTLLLCYCVEPIGSEMKHNTWQRNSLLCTGADSKLITWPILASWCRWCLVLLFFWWRIITLCWDGFYHTSIWISHRCICPMLFISVSLLEERNHDKNCALWF